MHSRAAASLSSGHNNSNRNDSPLQFNDNSATAAADGTTSHRSSPTHFLHTPQHYQHHHHQHHYHNYHHSSNKVVPQSEADQRDLVRVASPASAPVVGDADVGDAATATRSFSLKGSMGGFAAAAAKVAANVKGATVVGSKSLLGKLGTVATGLGDVSKTALDGTGNLLRSAGAGLSSTAGGGMSNITEFAESAGAAAEQALREELQDQMEKVREAAEATNPVRIWRKLLSDVDEKMNESVLLDTTGLTGWRLRYLTLANYCRGVLDTSQWTVFIYGCIFVAGLMVGLLTYPGVDKMVFVKGVELFILAAFCLEIVMKMIAEGWTPWTYFTNSEWKWNWLDFTVVMFSLPMPYGRQQDLKMLRLLRLLRFSRMVNEIPNLKLIISGLISSLNFVSYIVLLWFMVIYIYAILGIEIFGANDPFHFRSIEIAVVTLFQVTVMDMWGEIMYINYYGCEVYPSVFYTSDPTLGSNKIGQLMLCDHPTASPMLTSSFFLSYLLITSFCIVPLFTASVFVSMADCVQEMEMNRVSTHRKRSLKKLEKKKADLKKNHRRLDYKTKITLQLMSLAFQGNDITERVNSRGDLIESEWQLWYVGVSEACKDFMEGPLMREVMMEVLIASGIVVGLYTNPAIELSHGRELYITNWVLQGFFCLEVVLKIVGEGVHPQMYFYSAWNLYDFCITVCTMIPVIGAYSTVLRLFRLFRLIRLAKELRQLQVIVAGGIKGLNSATYILAILTMTYYIYAIIANSLLAKNDVATFGLLHRGMAILAQISTLDNWATYLYTSLYGCANQPSPLQFYADECTHSQGHYLTAVIFFFTFTIFGSYILLSLFIGAIYIGMETENNAQEVLLHVEDEVREISRRHQLTPTALSRYQQVFAFLDITDSQRLLKEELMFGMEAGTGSVLERDEFEHLWNIIDADGGGDIDFAEFLMFMTSLRKMHIAHMKAESEAAAAFALASGCADGVGGGALTDSGMDPGGGSGSGSGNDSPSRHGSIVGNNNPRSRNPTMFGATLLRRTLLVQRSASTFSRGTSGSSKSGLSTKGGGDGDCDGNCDGDDDVNDDKGKGKTGGDGGGGSGQKGSRQSSENDISDRDSGCGCCSVERKGGQERGEENQKDQEDQKVAITTVAGGGGGGAGAGAGAAMSPSQMMRQTSENVTQKTTTTADAFDAIAAGANEDEGDENINEIRVVQTSTSTPTPSPMQVVRQASIVSSTTTAATTTAAAAHNSPPTLISQLTGQMKKSDIITSKPKKEVEVKGGIIGRGRKLKQDSLNASQALSAEIATIRDEELMKLAAAGLGGFGHNSSSSSNSNNNSNK